MSLQAFQLFVLRRPLRRLVPLQIAEFGGLRGVDPLERRVFAPEVFAFKAFAPAAVLLLPVEL